MQIVKSLTIYHLVLALMVLLEIHSDIAVLSLRTVSTSYGFFKQVLKLKYVAVKHEPVNSCQPSPCGPNSQCREVNGQAVCSCLPTFIGSPPQCRPECTVSSECARDKACINQKCADPCPGTCGLSAKCQVMNHSPICSCMSGYTGDPFTRCFAIPRKLYVI